MHHCKVYTTKDKTFDVSRAVLGRETSTVKRFRCIHFNMNMHKFS